MSMVHLADLSHRRRRALLKKLKRKKLRQAAARLRDEHEAEELAKQEASPSYQAKLMAKVNQEAEEAAARVEEERLWLEREAAAQLQWKQSKEREEATRVQQLEAQAKIRLEWEKRQANSAASEVPDENNGPGSKGLANPLNTTKDENLPPWHHPPPPALPPHSLSTKPVDASEPRRSEQLCSFFRKTGACRYGLYCSRYHDYPVRCGSHVVSDLVDSTGDGIEEESSTVDNSCYALCLPNMFSHPLLPALAPAGVPNELEEPESLSGTEEAQLLADYADFYADVREELETRWGRIISFRTCRNRVEHLRGSVYVEFDGGSQAAWDAAEICSGRWFAGRVISCHVVRLAGGWREAICGLYHRGRCPKGDFKCNFLHVFHNPGETAADLSWSLNKDRFSGKRRTSSPRAHDRPRGRRGRESHSPQRRRYYAKYSARISHRRRSPSVDRRVSRRRYSSSRSPKHHWPASPRHQSPLKRRISHKRHSFGSHYRAVLTGDSNSRLSPMATVRSKHRRRYPSVTSEVVADTSFAVQPSPLPPTSSLSEVETVGESSTESGSGVKHSRSTPLHHPYRSPSSHSSHRSTSESFTYSEGSKVKRKKKRKKKRHKERTRDISGGNSQEST